MFIVQYFDRYLRDLNRFAGKLNREISGVSSHNLREELIVRVLQSGAGPACLESNHLGFCDYRFYSTLRPESLHVDLFWQVFLQYFGFPRVEHFIHDIFEFLKVRLRDG